MALLVANLGLLVGDPAEVVVAVVGGRDPEVGVVAKIVLLVGNPEVGVVAKIGLLVGDPEVGLVPDPEVGVVAGRVEENSRRRRGLRLPTWRSSCASCRWLHARPLS